MGTLGYTLDGTDSPICTYLEFYCDKSHFKEVQKECNKVNEKTLINIENMESSSSDEGELWKR